MHIQNGSYEQLSFSPNKQVIIIQATVSTKSDTPYVGITPIYGVALLLVGDQPITGGNPHMWVTSPYMGI